MAWAWGVTARDPSTCWRFFDDDDTDSYPVLRYVCALWREDFAGRCRRHRYVQTTCRGLDYGICSWRTHTRCPAYGATCATHRKGHLTWRKSRYSGPVRRFALYECMDFVFVLTKGGHVRVPQRSKRCASPRQRGCT